MDGPIQNVLPKHTKWDRAPIQNVFPHVLHGWPHTECFICTKWMAPYRMGYQTY